MNSVDMPGFTAEAALYVTSGRYQLISDNNASEGTERIVPQRIWYCWVETVLTCSSTEWGCSEFPYLRCRDTPKIFS